MKNFLERTLRQKVTMSLTTYLDGQLPLSFTGQYKTYKMDVGGLSWIAIEPMMDVGLVAIRKDRAKVENLSGINCAVFLNDASFYIKEKLLEEGIPFVIRDKQIYLPFIGILLSKENQRNIAPVHLISYLTQKMLIVAIYEKWENVTVSEAARRLGVSKMSMSRCFDEIEYLNINILGNKGKSRAILVPKEIEGLWNQTQRLLRNPVVERFELKDDLKLNKKAGISALSRYSLLSDNSYPTYGVTKEEIVELGIRKKKIARDEEEIGCVVLELGYFINYKNEGFEDPLSVSLSFTDEQLSDERINISINQMLKENLC